MWIYIWKFVFNDFPHHKKFLTGEIGHLKKSLIWIFFWFSRRLAILTLCKYFDVNSAGTALSYNHCWSKCTRREINEQRYFEIRNSVNKIARGDMNIKLNFSIIVSVYHFSRLFFYQEEQMLIILLPRCFQRSLSRSFLLSARQVMQGINGQQNREMLWYL